MSDLFDPVLKNISVSLNGQPLALSTGYSYNQTSGQFDSVPGVITVPAAAYSQNDQGIWTVQPGVSILTVTGTLSGGTQVS